MVSFLGAFDNMDWHMIKMPLALTQKSLLTKNDKVWYDQGTFQ